MDHIVKYAYISHGFIENEHILKKLNILTLIELDNILIRLSTSNPDSSVGRVGFSDSALFSLAVLGEIER